MASGAGHVDLPFLLGSRSFEQGKRRDLAAKVTGFSKIHGIDPGMDGFPWSPSMGGSCVVVQLRLRLRGGALPGSFTTFSQLAG
jgi:hypothetical protein